MIITITLNPAMDKTATIDELFVGELNRLLSVRVDVAGKGINVSKSISALGGASIAVGFVGTDNREMLLNALESIGITADFINTRSNIRTNLKIIDNLGRLTELNEPGIEVTQAEADALLDKITNVVRSGTIVVMSGSLCQGVDCEFYARLIRQIHKNGGFAFLDTSGDALRAAIKEKPDFIKPNKHELMEFFGINDDISYDNMQKLCQQLMGFGIPKIALSLGRDGAMFFDNKNYFRAEGLNVNALSPVGAGDNMMGAIAYAVERNMPWQECARLAVAASAGAVTTQGTNPPSRTLVDELAGQVRFV